MILQNGDRVLIAHRRLYEKDEPRFFVGEILAYDQGVMKIAGYSFIRDVTSGKIIRKDELRIKIISISSYAFLTYLLPADSDIASVHFINDQGRQMLVDGKTLNMNLSEYPHYGSI